jgi:hypothetical protein
MNKIIKISITSFLLITSCTARKNIMQKKEFKFYTDYHQFYIEDAKDKNKENISSPDFWNEKAYSEKMALTKGIIGVGVQSYGNYIKGDIELLEKPNTEIDFSRYDHIVEGGIELNSNEIQLLNCPDGNLELSLKIKPGKYRVRVYSSNLASVKETDLANDTDDDYYHIEVWPSEDMERKVLKQYEYKE